MTPDMEQVILNRLTEVAQQHAAAAQMQATTAERTVGVLERLDEHMSRMDYDRDRYAVEVKRHVTETVKAQMEAADHGQRRIMMLCGVLVAMAEFLRVGLESIVHLFH